MTKAARLLALAALAASPLSAQLPFVPFEARSVGLGGASVALPRGSFLDNPALVDDSNFATVLSAGGVGRESGDFLDPLKRLSGGKDSAADVLRDLGTLSDPANGVIGTGRAGLAASSRRWGLSITELAFASVVADVELVNPPATNTSRERLLGLRIRDAAVTYSYSLFHGISVGVTGHALRGTTFAKEESVFTADVSNPFQTARGAFDGAERTRTRFTWDAGVLASLGPVRAAIVWKSINRPSFPFADEGPAAERGLAVTYGRQARVGAAAKLPILGILATADLDLTKNQTLTPGLKSREVGGGVEVPLAIFVFRGGMSVNLESPDKSRVVHAGLGVNAKLVRVDAGVAWRPGNSAVGGVLSVRAGI